MSQKDVMEITQCKVEHSPNLLVIADEDEEDYGYDYHYVVDQDGYEYGYA